MYIKDMKDILFCRSVTSSGRPKRSRGKAILTQLNSKLLGEEHFKGAAQEVQGYPLEPSKEEALGVKGRLREDQGKGS